MQGCILFTDVKASSKLWADHPQEMLKLLMAHEKIIRAAIAKYKGLLVKTIGDAVMAKFAKLINGVKCAIDIQTSLKNKPLKFNKSSDLLQIRIGIGYGSMQMRHIIMQGHKMKDFFGSSVNIASRMESKVSKVGGFGILADKMPKSIIELIESKCHTQRVDFKYQCNTPVIRSKRLLISDSVAMCHDVSILHIEDGKEHVALSCELK
jgi:hypothetical protein